MSWTRGWQTFSAKDQRVNILGFEGHMVSVAIFQSCRGNKAATDNISMNGPGCMASTVSLLTKTAGGLGPWAVVS